MRKLVLIAAMIAAGLASVLTAAPPAAANADGCWGDCGEAEIFNAYVTSSSPVYGDELTFVVEIRDVSESCAVSICNAPGGTIILYDGDAEESFAAAILQQGVYDESRVVIPYASLRGGSHTIKVDYRFGSHDSTSTSFVLGIQPRLTETRLVAPSHSVVGQDAQVVAHVNFVGSIDDGPNGPRHPTGPVELYDGGALVATAQVDDGSAAFDVSFPSAGRRFLWAWYRGDGNYDFSISPTIEHSTLKGNTVTSLTRSKTTSVFGELVDFTAQAVPVAPAAGQPTGQLELHINGGPYTSGPAENPLLVGLSNLPMGDNKLHAVYLGSPDFNGSASAEITHTVTKAATTTGISSTPNPSNVGQEVTLTATVGVVAPGAGSPSGGVQFYDGATPLGNAVALNGPVATLRVSALAGNSHAITARYLGDSRFESSTSPAHFHVVRCDRTVSGAISGNYAVPATGATCISGAQITGGLTVPAGARVAIADSSVGGYLTADGAATLLTCGTTVGGVQIARSAGAVVFGDPAQGCRGNTVSSGAQFTSNRGGLRIGGNRIAGWLQCSGNTPVPTNGGTPNTAAGRTGDCASAGF